MLGLHLLFVWTLKYLQEKCCGGTFSKNYEPQFGICVYFHSLLADTENVPLSIPCRGRATLGGLIQLL